jgi:hypothetical protein
MKSLRKQVFEYLAYCRLGGNLHGVGTKVKDVYKYFPDEPKDTLEQYFYQWKKENNPNVSTNIELINLDTIKEMELSINQIKDPVKRCENLSRLHATMKIEYDFYSMIKMFLCGIALGVLIMILLHSIGWY